MLHIIQIWYKYYFLKGTQLNEHIEAVDGLGDRITTVLNQSSLIKTQRIPTEIILANQRLKHLKKVQIS